MSSPVTILRVVRIVVPYGRVRRTSVGVWSAQHLFFGKCPSGSWWGCHSHGHLLCHHYWSRQGTWANQAMRVHLGCMNMNGEKGVSSDIKSSKHTRSLIVLPPRLLWGEWLPEDAGNREKQRWETEKGRENPTDIVWTPRSEPFIGLSRVFFVYMCVYI